MFDNFNFFKCVSYFVLGTGIIWLIFTLFCWKSGNNGPGCGGASVEFEPTSNRHSSNCITTSTQPSLSLSVRRRPHSPTAIQPPPPLASSSKTTAVCVCAYGVSDSQRSSYPVKVCQTDFEVIFFFFFHLWFSSSFSSSSSLFWQSTITLNCLAFFLSLSTSSRSLFCSRDKSHSGSGVRLSAATAHASLFN